ncbi:MAG: hypothetical protein PHW04_07055 [Candidatus Wallbacteria bacterium]|nr:hypothetical protein [Candidatus Wallbacteria bacterium]
MKRIFISVLFCLLLKVVSIPLFAEESEKTPVLILYYQEAFHVAGQLADRLWPAVHIPYQEVPVLAYDPVKKEEYLINHPDPDLKNYEPTEYFINSKRVFKKKGPLSFNCPGGRACSMINGFPVVTMGYGEDSSLEDVIINFIHEGFHYYQFGNLYRIGKDDLMSRLKKDFFSENPRTAEYDADLVMEGKILAELTEKKSRKKNGESLLEKIVAVDEMKKKKMSKKLIRGENYEYLIEGTASFVELKALEILTAEGVKNSTIPEGKILSYSYFKGDQIKKYYQTNLEHFGPQMLRNKINQPSTNAGEIEYRYALALIRVFDEFCNDDEWKKGLFPLLDPSVSSDEAEESVSAHLDKYNLPRKISEIFNLSDDRIMKIYRQVLNEYLSSGEMLVINDKTRIEKYLSIYPFEKGWTYKIEAGQFLYTYFDWVYGKAYCDKKMTNFVYFCGLFKLETPDKNLTVEEISIPVISNMFKGEIRFKDIGNDLSKAELTFSDNSNGVCQNFELKIPGLKLKAKKAEIIHDKIRKETMIRLK